MKISVRYWTFLMLAMPLSIVAGWGQDGSTLLTQAAFTVGGTVSGLTGTGLILQNNGVNNLAVKANGAFTFSKAVARGAAYKVTILTQPQAQSCTVTKGSGKATADVKNVKVACLGISIGKWAWMGGSSTVGGEICDNNLRSPGSFCGRPGVYGTLGTASATNIPGGREGAASWSNGAGKLWLFGGDGLNDLWKFNPKLGKFGEWTWMGGSSTFESCGNSDCLRPGVYGTLGEAGAKNIPGGRSGAVSWSDASGNLWLFGGQGYGATVTYGWLNDLWKFDPTLGEYGEWTWMGGSSTVVGSCDRYVQCGQPGVYGMLGMAESTNIPGGRYSSVSWSDESGNLWLFSGLSYDSTGTLGYLNDLWKYH
jgi:hypothetical protein